MHTSHLKRREHSPGEVCQALHPQGAGLAHLGRDQQRDVRRELEEHVVVDWCHREGHVPLTRRRKRGEEGWVGGGGYWGRKVEKCRDAGDVKAATKRRRMRSRARK